MQAVHSNPGSRALESFEGHSSTTAGPGQCTEATGAGHRCTDSIPLCLYFRGTLARTVVLNMVWVTCIFGNMMEDAHRHYKLPWRFLEILRLPCTHGPSLRTCNLQDFNSPRFLPVERTLLWSPSFVTQEPHRTLVNPQC